MLAHALAENATTLAIVGLAVSLSLRTLVALATDLTALTADLATGLTALTNLA